MTDRKTKPIELHVVALSDPDLDRLWVCVRHCRQTLEKSPGGVDLVGELRGLERTLSEIGR